MLPPIDPPPVNKKHLGRAALDTMNIPKKGAH
jgi:hypothetical protein